ncbi:MAG TPA: hypothetical protein VGX25_20425 [Actinophytocola sp.]|uniref:hypothetical protein n=1 Tax=Actinophytocola sp. TaxID=1872138 RepID=UPI002DDCA847|nr:hypothetical protein [Actinophytocola sp.]HEV2781758.1 hypothetical protein [Actinophytocola sp.]
MTELIELRARITRLEERMDDVQNLAEGTDQEVSGWRGVLMRHTDVLNGMSESLDRFRRSIDERFAKVDERFAKVDERFDRLEAKVDDGFTKINLSHAEIIARLNVAIGRPDDET